MSSQVNRYVIAGPIEDGEEQLFWSNDNGWVDLTDATVFSEDEVSVLDLPDDAAGWKRLPGDDG